MRLNISEIYWNGFTHPSGKEPLEKVWKGEAIGETKKKIGLSIKFKEEPPTGSVWVQGTSPNEYYHSIESHNHT